MSKKTSKLEQNERLTSAETGELQSCGGCKNENPDCANCDRLSEDAYEQPQEEGEQMRDDEYSTIDEACDAAYLLAQMTVAVEKMAEGAQKTAPSKLVREAADTFAEMVKEAYCDWCGGAFAMSMLDLVKDDVEATPLDD